MERWWGADPALLPATACEGFCYDCCQMSPIFVILPMGLGVLVFTLLSTIWCAPCFGREAVGRLNARYLLLGERELYLVTDEHTDGCPQKRRTKGTNSES